MTELRQPVYVGRVVYLIPHFNADDLDLLTFSYKDGELRLVVGKHYRPGDLGIWLPPGTIIPGWLSYQLWMHGKRRIPQDFEVRAIEMRGVASPGLWVGQWSRNDKSKESILSAAARERGGGRVVDGWIEWAHWQPEWHVGDVLALEDIHNARVAQLAEQQTASLQVAAPATEPVGSNPAASSTESEITTVLEAAGVLLPHEVHERRIREQPAYGSPATEH